MGLLNKRYLNQKGVTHIFLLISLVVIAIVLITQPFNNIKDFLKNFYQTEKVYAVSRGVAGDLWADVILGKSDFSEITPFTVTPNKLFLPHGVIVDRTASPNKLYVYDAGNNRILGFDLAKCLASSTDSLNCSADLVIGQLSLTTSACNGDSGFQNYPSRAPASASTLCGEVESTGSISEGGSGSSMAIDSEGNLYVNDGENHRVLKYIRPFETDKIADEVWGQVDFSGNSCNKGLSSPDATTICFNWGNSNNWTAGVEVDSSGNVWVADNGNNRVLRFPAGSKTADLVLGQSSFNSNGIGGGLNQLNAPAAVRVNAQGSVYVADQGNKRVMVYDAPLGIGMSGRAFGSGFERPSGVDLDPTEPGKVWITDMGNEQLKLIDESSEVVVRTLGRLREGNILGDVTGSIGIDSSGNVYAALGKGDNNNDVVMYSPGGSLESPTKKLFGAAAFGNQVADNGLASGAGIAIADNQLIVADRGRLLFWNDPSSLTNGKSADGVTGVGGINNFSTIKGLCCYNIKADKNHHLYVTAPQEAAFPDRVEIYQLPLTTGALPIKTITFPLNVLGGGQVSSTWQYQSFSGVAVSDTGDFLWLAHAATNRVFRVRNPLTNPEVDVILGQVDSNGTSCNRGGAVQSNSLCNPGGLSLDRFGNLYVSDHWLEISGNMRLLEFNKDLFPTDNTSVIYAPAASKIFPNIATWEPAFDSQNRMVIGFNPYWTANPSGGWFPAVYSDPLSSSTTPNDFIKDYHSMAFSATFDSNDNLYIGDLNRSRVLIYKGPLNFATPTPTSTPGSASGDSTPPTVSITSPTNGSIVKRNNRLTIRAIASDNVKVTKVEFYVDNNLRCTDNTASYTCKWRVPSGRNITYTILAKAYDAAGNSATATIKVTSSK